MKKILLILLGLLLITGCSRNSEILSIENPEAEVEIEEKIIEEEKEAERPEDPEENEEEDQEEENSPPEIKNPHLELKDRIMGIWTYEDMEGQTEEYRIKITDEQMIQYIADSEILADGPYEITSYDSESQELEINGTMDIASIKLIDDKTIEIISKEGMVSTWHYLYGLDEGFEY